MLSGKMLDATPWTSCRLVPLTKANGKIRPIAVGDTWLRFLGRATCPRISATVGPLLLPNQFGVGIRGGAEKVIHQLNLINEYMNAASNNPDIDDNLDDPIIIMSLDVANAYNTIRRKPVYTQVEKYCPDLLRYYKWLYGSAAPLFLGTGELICHSYTGLRQGDSFASLFFSVAVQPLLLHVQRQYHQITVLGFIDDTNLAGRRSQVIPAARKLIELMETELGLILNLDKTGLLDYTLHDVEEYEGFKVLKHGKILGGPLGEYNTSTIVGRPNKIEEEVHREMDAKCTVVSTITPQICLQAINRMH
jgi:hypothetical protein